MNGKFVKLKNKDMNIKLLKRMVPSNLKQNLRSFFKETYGFKEEAELKILFETKQVQTRAEIEKSIPIVDLEEKHISNLEVLVNRIALLGRLPKNSVCAEIGVNQGEFSAEILKHASPKKLHLIDAWADTERYHDGLRKLVEDKFYSEIIQGFVEINRGFSTDVLNNFPDCYFDWVYLDTNHTYCTTAAELQVLKTKVKPGGIIAGHDYIIGNWVGGYRYGVIEAVHELCLNHNWELIYITINKNEMPSFAVKQFNVVL